MARRQRGFDLVLFLLILFLGWLGIDKLYKGDGKMFVIKLLLNFLIIGEIWNIIDLIFCVIGKYKVNPMDYLK